MASELKMLVGGLIVAVIGSVIGMYFVSMSPMIPEDVIDDCRAGSTPAELGYPEYNSCREMEESQQEGMVPGLAGCCLICPAGLVVAGIGGKQMHSAKKDTQAVVLQHAVAEQVSGIPAQNAQPIQQQPSGPSPFDGDSRF